MNDHVDNKRKKQTLFNIPLDSFSNYLNVNLIALFSVCREFARNNKKGSIVNFSATTGIVSARPDLYNGSHKHIGYSVSKAGVINLTKYLATYWNENGVRVNALVPGGVYDGQSKEFVEKLSKLIPLGRMAEVDEYKSSVAYLISDASSYMTGSVVVVDGGRTSW